jgi:hypothetical protein
MPIVSINLNGASYRVYEQWKKTRSGSRMVSAAIMAYELRQLEDRLRPGDVRSDADGNYSREWSGDKGWIPLDGEEE